MKAINVGAENQKNKKENKKMRIFRKLFGRTKIERLARLKTSLIDEREAEKRKLQRKNRKIGIKQARLHEQESINYDKTNKKVDALNREIDKIVRAIDSEQIFIEAIAKQEKSDI